MNGLVYQKPYRPRSVVQWHGVDSVSLYPLTNHGTHLFVNARSSMIQHSARLSVNQTAKPTVQSLPCTFRSPRHSRPSFIRTSWMSWSVSVRRTKHQGIWSTAALQSPTSPVDIDDQPTCTAWSFSGIDVAHSAGGPSLSRVRPSGIHCLSNCVNRLWATVSLHAHWRRSCSRDTSAPSAIEMRLCEIALYKWIHFDIWHLTTNRCCEIWRGHSPLYIGNVKYRMGHKNTVIWFSANKSLYIGTVQDTDVVTMNNSSHTPLLWGQERRMCNLSFSAMRIERWTNALPISALMLYIGLQLVEFLILRCIRLLL